MFGIISGLLVLFCCCATASEKIIIGIAGGSGSGKTTLAKKIIAAFPDHSVLISQDAYYHDLGHLPMEKRSEVNFDHPQSIDFELLKTHLLELKNNSPIDVPVYNFSTHSREPFCQTITPAQVIIVEGILLFAVEEIRDLFDLKIYVDADDDIRVLRRIERDINERGRTFISVRDQYLRTVKPMHDIYVEPSKQFANVIIPSNSRNERALDVIISKINEDLQPKHL